MSKVSLVTFSDESMSRSAELCVESAKRHGVDDAIRGLPAEPSTERGYGFWKWKPRIILNRMIADTGFTSPLPDNSILIYSDAGVEFIAPVNHIIDRMDQDIFLFGNMYDHKDWCKADIIKAIWPVTDDSGRWQESEVSEDLGWARFGKQVQASVIFFRVNDKTRAFVKEWLDWCLSGARIGAGLSFGLDNPEHENDQMTWSEFRYLIDDSPSVTPNHPRFQENRHDQAILTTMAYRDGYKLHWWPSVYNDGAFTYERGDYPDEGYPVLFHHHRRRNHEWSSAA